MKVRTIAMLVAVTAFTMFSMCAAFTFTEPMCRTPECMPADASKDGDR